MKITKYYRHVKTTYWKTAFLIALAGLFLLPSYTKIEKTGNNVYEITLNGEQVGTVSDTKDADSLLWQARKEIAKEEDVLFLADAELSVTGREAYFAQFTGEDEIIANMKEVLTASQISTIVFESKFVLDTAVATATAVLLLVCVCNKESKLKRSGGIIMLAAYAAYFVKLLIG